MLSAVLGGVTVAGGESWYYCDVDAAGDVVKRRGIRLVAW